MPTPPAPPETLPPLEAEPAAPAAPELPPPLPCWVLAEPPDPECRYSSPSGGGARLSEPQATESARLTVNPSSRSGPRQRSENLLLRTRTLRSVASRRFAELSADPGAQKALECRPKCGVYGWGEPPASGCGIKEAMRQCPSLEPKTSLARGESRRAAWGALISIAASAACATGVDVSDSELAELCATQGIICDDGATASAQGGSSGSSGGTAGTAGVSGSSSTGGTQQSNAGTSGTGGASGSSGTSGSSGSSGASGNSGASGSAGSGNAPLQPLAQGTCMAGTDQVVIVYTDRGNGSVNSNQATMTLKVQNDGAAFDLTDLTMRYWFTDDGLSDFIAEVDYAAQTNGSSFSKTDVSVTFAEESGSNYALIGFTAGDSVGPEGVDQVQLRIHTNSYQMLDQSNDFSFSGGGTAIDNRNITPYINGVQVGGCVPLPP